MLAAPRLRITGVWKKCVSAVEIGAKRDLHAEVARAPTSRARQTDTSDGKWPCLFIMPLLRTKVMGLNIHPPGLGMVNLGVGTWDWGLEAWLIVATG